MRISDWSSDVCSSDLLANLGRLDRLADDQLDPLINGLQRALGRVPVAAPVPQYDSALAFGDVYALHALWNELGFGKGIRTALRSSRRSFDAEALVRAMVFNRLCAPDRSEEHTSELQSLMRISYAV